MLEIISTIATVVQTALAWLDYSQNQKAAKTATKKRRQTPRVSQEHLNEKVRAVLIELMNHEHLIELLSFMGVILLLGVSLFAVALFDDFYLHLRNDAQRFVLLIAVLVMGTIVVYGVLLGIAKFVLGKLLKYYGLKKNEHSHLKVLIQRVDWRVSSTKWILLHILAEMDRDSA